ncbi:MAG: 3-deoxy-manno-octulosonate cytidylyltransferase [Candidatus Omnitrophica bacterium]|nr:3-deoxy-manno-octulosonate cytidylyltransferase [Candidatus Omnitrophota bacterium]
MIPARMASSRFPGKPLIEVEGLPMIEHVRRRALLCRRFAQVVVATCDREIAGTVERFGGEALMTSPDHPAATDRVAEAARRLDCTHVVNIQGDEILVMPSDLERFVRAVESRPEIPAWNAVSPMEGACELADRSIVKCMVSQTGRIFFCARDFSRFKFSPDGLFEPARKLLGVLGYRRDFLERYGSLPRTPFEVAESLDQSRILEQEIPLQSVCFDRGYLGVNEPREAEAAQRCLASDPNQRSVLKELLTRA